LIFATVFAVFQDIKRGCTLSRERWESRAESGHFALTPTIEHVILDSSIPNKSIFLKVLSILSGISRFSFSTPLLTQEEDILLPTLQQLQQVVPLLHEI
jgi:hypothetical protein